MRTGVLLAYRRADDPRVAHFLEDPEPLLRVEAARAIYDRPIRAALPALARFAGAKSPFTEDEAQTHHAWHRRVIGAALAVGDSGSALGLAAHAADEGNPLAMRSLALESLASFTVPGPRDLAMGWWRPLPERERTVVHAAFDAHGARLVDDPDLGDRALEIASAYDRLVLDEADLVALVEDAGRTPSRRIAALSALSKRPEVAPATARAAAETALASGVPLLRAEARDVLAKHDPAAALAALRGMPADATLRERQRGYQTLAALDHPDAGLAVQDAFGALTAGQLPNGVALDVMDLVRARGDATQNEALEVWRGSRETQGWWALDGGDVARGQRVFQGNGDCARCHGAGGHGAGAGPQLEGLVEKRGAEYVLESILEPQAEVVQGFAQMSVVLRDGTVVGGTLVGDTPEGIVLRGADGEQRFAAGEIASRSAPISAMPPIGAALPDRELRDLMAYLKTL